MKVTVFFLLQFYKRFFKAYGRGRRNGFTLLEVLLTVVLIGILASIVILAINPAKQIGGTKNVERKVDVNTILNAVYQYTLDNNGLLPSSIPAATCGTATTEICRTGVVPATCTSENFVDLTTLTTNEKYLVSISIDPNSTSTGYNGTGYHIAKNINSRVTVCAPLAEVGATISVTR